MSIAVNPDKKCVRWLAVLPGDQRRGALALVAAGRPVAWRPRPRAHARPICVASQLFSIDERQALVKRMCEAELGTDARRVRVVSFDGLVVEFAKENDVNFLVRGLRAFSGASLGAHAAVGVARRLPTSLLLVGCDSVAALTCVCGRWRAVQTSSTSSAWPSSIAS